MEPAGFRGIFVGEGVSESFLLQGVNDLADKISGFFRRIEAFRADVLQIIPEGIQKAGLQNLKQNNASSIVFKHNGAGFAADAEPEIFRQMVQGVAEDPIRALQTVEPYAFQNLDSLCHRKRCVEHRRDFFHQSGTGEMHNPFFGKIQEKTAQLKLSEISGKGLKGTLKNLFSLRQTVVKNTIQHILRNKWR